MPAVYKATLMFRFSPNENLWNIETPGKVGGWSESYWTAAPPTTAFYNNWSNARAALLGTDCVVTGWKTTPYVFTGNKLIPGKSSVGVLQRAGSQSAQTNSPDDALRILATAGGVPISFTTFLHAVPDVNIESGQFVSDASFNEPLDALFNFLMRPQPAAAGVPIYWLGRDPTQIAQRVIAVDGVAKTVKTQFAVGAVVGTDFIRLRRVYDSTRKPIIGTFLVTAAVNNPDGSFTYTVAGLPNQSNTVPSGTARVDKIAISAVTQMDVRSLGERKVGRPTLLYRGRRTRTRV